MKTTATGVRFASLLAEVDNAFRRVQEQFSREVRCQPGCDDCCHAVFTVSLVEAWYIERYLREVVSVEDPRLLLRLQARGENFEAEKQKMGRQLPLGDEGRASRERLAKWRIRCPMLQDRKSCAIYEKRPVTCRIYGLPLSIGGSGHVCGFSGFEKGKDYPTIKMENINGYLRELSQKLAAERGLPPEKAERRYYLYEVLSALKATR